MKPKLFYTAPNAKCGDIIPKYIDGKYQLFYLKHWLDRDAPDFVPGWHRMESKDLVHMGPETPIHVNGGTGDIVRHNGQWHLFACIFPEGKQYVTHYISKDGSLDNWEYQEADTFGPDGEIYHCSDWRDPRIVYREELGEYWMFLAARANRPHSQTGCVGLCVSKDLKTWEYREPIYFPERFNGACECPDVFRMGDWYYLVFSSYTNLFGTYYVKCHVGETQWQIPKNHRLDARAFYAAKTAGHDMERYICGWNPTKDENIFGFWPDKFKGRDYRTWDWGGGMVVHRLIQQPDGDLGLALPESKKALFTHSVPNSFSPVTEGWQESGGCWTAKTASSQQMLLMQQMPETCYIHVKIRSDGAHQAGVILQASEEMREGYYIYVEPEMNRLVFRSWLRMYEEGGKTFPYDIELEVPLRRPGDGVYHMEVVTEGTVGLVYVNSEAAMSFRMYDYQNRNLGLFSFGKAEFSQIEMREREYE
ncbi:glycoside hydrolase family 32 protein [Acutalibacter muris]|uniref:glycoside hydrolase family 32 protein n=1 Tax=Acutalibacter muris TaxID=1796620 RepID=UPI001C3EC0A8|nr:glycoside hydrolase family 32 protein [Acutalibacter muris]